ncbi:hypothetical protein E4U17_002533 [Claviceps sp. LM77 group G4]|nr:hypothetical protein E4U17_002533 [Claviceps sp. LM77 group G4]
MVPRPSAAIIWRHVTRTTPLRGEREIEVFGRMAQSPSICGRDQSRFCRAYIEKRSPCSYSQIGVVSSATYVALSRDSILSHNTSSRRPLEPFGANKADIHKALINFICELEKGKYVVVKGESVFVCAFIGALVGDVIEQQELSGCMGHQAVNGCRYCLIKKYVCDMMELYPAQEGQLNPHHRRKANKLRATTKNIKKRKTKYGIKDDCHLMDAFGLLLFIHRYHHLLANTLL